MQSLSAYLAELERTEDPLRADGLLLWPNTPIGDAIQDRIRERVGVSDRDAGDRRSRPARIGRLLERAVRRRVVPPAFSVLDIACGDGLVLLDVKRRFADAACFGVDLNAGAFPAHDAVRAAGIELYRVAIQRLFREPPPVAFDVVLMLNTYRSWDAADLGPDDGDLPATADAWIAAHATLFVTTLTAEQARRWQERGFDVVDLGPGEDDSRLAAIVHGRSLRSRLFGLL